MRRNVSLHTMSPGMVFTDMLLEDSGKNERKFFDILADEPEEVGEELVQKLLAVAMTDETGENIQYLDPPKIIQRLLSPALWLTTSTKYYTGCSTYIAYTTRYCYCICIDNDDADGF